MKPLLYLGMVVMPCLAREEPHLRALSEIETGGRKGVVGKAGERSEYQISFAVYHQHTDKSYLNFISDMSIPDVASTLAWTHRLWLRDKFEDATGKKPNEAEFYAMWNLGFAGFKRRGFVLSACPARTRDAAVRYSNLVHVYQSQN